MKIYTIYSVTCRSNGKKYIGFDSNWPRRRIEHLYSSKKMDRGVSMSIFHKAMKKYGIENFDWEILYQSMERDHTLKTMEPYFIQEQNSFIPNGYNMTRGGDGVFGRVLLEKHVSKDPDISPYIDYEPLTMEFMKKWFRRKAT